MASVSIVFRKDKINSKNEAPIHLRIIKDRRIRYISTQIMIPLDCWDFNSNKVKSKFPNSARINSMIWNKFLELQDEVLMHETETKSLTTRQLKDKIIGKKPVDFLEFAKEANKVYLADGKIGTYDKNVSIIAKIEKYFNGQACFFQDITVEFLSKYEKHLKTEYKNSTNTVHSNLKFIRKLFNDAIRMDLIDVSVNPFLRYQLKVEKTQRQFLTEEELTKIENYEAPEKSVIGIHKDMFVFACYAGGIRVSDLLQIKWRHFDGANINFTIKKTGSQLSIKIPNKGLEIMNKYKPIIEDRNKFIFPLLSSSVDLNNLRALDSAISSASSSINNSLNKITDAIELDKHISFHISRHTWATRALKKGISIDKVSKLMGHSNIKETQIYAKIINTELDKAMDIFNS